MEFLEPPLGLDQPGIPGRQRFLCRIELGCDCLGAGAQVSGVFIVQRQPSPLFRDPLGNIELVDPARQHLNQPDLVGDVALPRHDGTVLENMEELQILSDCPQQIERAPGLVGVIDALIDILLDQPDIGVRKIGIARRLDQGGKIVAMLFGLISRRPVGAQPP